MPAPIVALQGSDKLKLLHAHQNAVPRWIAGILGTGQRGVSHHIYLTRDLDMNQWEYLVSCLEQGGRGCAEGFKHVLRVVWKDLSWWHTGWPICHYLGQHIVAADKSLAIVLDYWVQESRNKGSETTLGCLLVGSRGSWETWCCCCCFCLLAV